MFEREEGQERSIEEILALTLERIQPVLRGDKRKTKILRDGEDSEFYPVSGIGRETAREVIKRLAEKLGADLTTGEEVSYEPIDPSGSMARAIYHHPTNTSDIVITAELILPWYEGYYWIRTLSIENLHPKTRLQRAVGRIRKTLGA